LLKPFLFWVKIYPRKLFILKIVRSLTITYFYENVVLCSMSGTWHGSSKGTGRFEPWMVRWVAGVLLTGKAVSCHDDAGVDFHLQRALDGGEDRREVAHGGIARGRQHPMQALGRLVNLFGQRFETDRRIDQITQDEFGGLGLAIDEQGDRLVEQRLGKSRVALHAGCHGFFEITGQCHGSRSFVRLECLAALVVLPQGQRLIDIFLLPLLAAAAEQDNELQAVFEIVTYKFPFSSIVAMVTTGGTFAAEVREAKK